MKSTTIKWHLARDNQLSLHKFCETKKVKQVTTNIYSIDGDRYFRIMYSFDNKGYIEAELRAGDTRSYSVADHFQVTSYDLGE